MKRSISIAVAAIMLVASVFFGATAFGTSRIIVKLATGANAATSVGYAATVDSLQSAGKVGLESSLFAKKAQTASLSSSVGGESFPFDKYRILMVEDDVQLEDILAVLNADRDIEYAEPDYPIEFFGTPDDPHLTNQWGVRNVGQSYLGIDRIDGFYNDVLTLKQGAIGADIHLSPTWGGEYSSGSPLLCIIDTGLDMDHPDIADNLWANPGEIPDNGIDDDHNGYIDDVLGWDFSGNSIPANPDDDPTDMHGHGTHRAGIVLSVTNNSLGTAGIVADGEIMALKFYPLMLPSFAAEAIVYAAGNGADVISMSWGLPYHVQIWEDVLDYAREKGVMNCADKLQHHFGQH